MRRRYSTAYFRDRLERVLNALPDAAIGTDLIVGFPGETASHFAEFLAFVENLPIAYFHVFPYSVREGTTAAKFNDRVAPDEIKRRAAVMRKVGEEKRQAFARKFVGRRLQVLFEEADAHGQLLGYSRNYVRVSAYGGTELSNHEVEVEGTLAEGAQLAGRIVERQERRRAAAAVNLAG